MDCVEEIPITVSPKSPDSRWVALDSNDKIIAEGKTPEFVVKEAEKRSDNFIIMYIPIEGNTYIF